MVYIYVFFLGFILSGVWFTCHMVINQYISKKHCNIIEEVLPLLSAFLPTVIICIVSKKHPFHLETLCNLELWGIALLTVCITSLIIIFLKIRNKENNTKKLFKKCVEAAFMEIPQRVMMQTFIYVLLICWNQNSIWCIFINACIWCLDILVQAFIIRQTNYRKIMIEVISSFVFSIGIGYIFLISECLIIPMISHGLERYITNIVILKENVFET